MQRPYVPSTDNVVKNNTYKEVIIFGAVESTVEEVKSSFKEFGCLEDVKEHPHKKGLKYAFVYKLMYY